jgi:hypothetical protein
MREGIRAYDAPAGGNDPALACRVRMNIDIRHLRYFRAVADERSFTRGAERLHMAQPPLSRRIQDLEAEIGGPLFERGQRPAAP